MFNDRRSWWLFLFLGAALGAASFQFIFKTDTHTLPAVGAELFHDASAAAVTAHAVAKSEGQTQPERPPAFDEAIAGIKQQIKSERAAQDKTISDAVARWPQEDQARAMRAWDSWYSVKPVFHNNGYGTWMFDALKNLFSPGEAAELTAFYMQLQSYESMRKLREHPQILLWRQEGGDTVLPADWQELYRTWDSRVKVKGELVPIAAAGVARIVGADGLARLVSGVTPPFSAEMTQDYDTKFRRWFSGNMLAKWRRFLFESEY